MDKVLWFASSNEHKIKEVAAFFAPYGYTIKSLLDLDVTFDIAETGTSYEENALIKANALANYTHAPAIGDDSGLEIKTLDNFPGIYSQRWKGTMTFHEAMENILEQLEDADNRQATMITALAYVNPEQHVSKVFLGKLDGEITQSLTSKHEDAFGYDQIFYVPSKNSTLYSMGTIEKNKISHRFQALSQLVKFLATNEHN